jgi:hypothetical protein
MKPQLRLRQIYLVVPNDCITVGVSVNLHEQPFIFQGSKGLLAQQGTTVVNANLSGRKTDVQLLISQGADRFDSRISGFCFHLFQSRKRLKGLGVPHSPELSLMPFGPIADQPLCAAWQVAFDHLHRSDLKNSAPIAVDCMKMRNPMLPKIHPDCDAVKSSNDRHAGKSAKSACACHRPNWTKRTAGSLNYVPSRVVLIRIHEIGRVGLRALRAQSPCRDESCGIMLAA